MKMPLPIQIVGGWDACESRIACAMLLDDGSVHFEIDGQTHEATNGPDGISSIVLAASGLWCLADGGAVYRWQGTLPEGVWQPALATGVIALGRLDDGRLCAVHRDESLVWEDDGWRTCPEATDWLRPVGGNGGRKHNRLNYMPRFSLRTLLVAMALIASLLGPLKARRDAERRAMSVTLLEASGCQVYYSHQIDANGELLRNAAPPGPAWLRKWLGDSLFLRPERIAAPAKAPMTEIAKLTSLRELSIRPAQGHKTIDANALAPLRNLERLSIKGVNIESIESISKLNRLESLELDACLADDGSGTFVSLTSEMITDCISDSRIERLRLRKIKSLDMNVLVSLPHQRLLRELAISPVYFDAEPLAKFGGLEQLEIRVNGDLSPLAKLHQLKSLKLLCRGEKRSDARDLSQLTGLESLTISGGVNVADLAWVTPMRQLRQFTLGGLRGVGEVDLDLSPLKSLSKLEEIWLDENLGFDVDLLPHTRLSITSIGLTGYSMRVKDRSISLARCGVRDLTFAAEKPEVHFVKLDGNELKDIDALRALRDLDGASLNDNPLANISALRWAWKLKRLSLNRTNVKDLESLQGKRRLERLELSKTQVGDVGSLADCLALKSLDLSHSKVADVSPLRKLVKLQWLDLSHSQVHDLSVLTSFPLLKTLDLSGLPISSFRLHEDARLSTLTLANTNVTDLHGLPQVAVNVDLSNTQVSDLSGVENWRALRSLKLKGTPVSDLRPLARSSVSALDLEGTHVADFEPLHGLPLLSLSLRGNKSVTDADLAWIKSMQRLLRLNLSGTSISDVSALGSWKPFYVRHLDLSDTPIRDLKGLGHLRVESLNVANTKITTIADLPWFTERNVMALDLSGCKLTALDREAISKAKHVRELRLYCGELRSLEPLELLEGVRRIQLDSLQPGHSCYWLAHTGNLLEMELIGGPIESKSYNRLFGMLRDAPRLRKLILPAGSVVDVSKYPVLRSMEVYVGGRRIKFEAPPE